MVMYANANCSHAVLFNGFVSLRCAFVSGKVNHSDRCVSQAVATRSENAARTALVKLRKPFKRAWEIN